MYQMLAPSKELERYALAMAKDDSESPSVRCRAIESLRSANDDAMFMQAIEIKRVQRLAHFEKDEIGDIDDVVDGAQADRFESARKPLRTGRDFTITNDSGGVGGAKIGRVIRDGT